MLGGAVEVINEALTEIGASPLQADAATSAHPRVQEFEATLEDLISRREWSFAATALRPCVRDASVDATPYEHAYQLPAARIGPPLLLYERLPDGVLRDFSYSEDGQKVLTNAGQVFARIRELPPVSAWPGHFRRLVVLALASRYALSVREDRTLREQLRQEAFGTPGLEGAGGQFAISAGLDSQARPPKARALPHNWLSGARWR